MLSQRILRPRGEHALTWKKCIEYGYLNRCKEFSPVEVYDISVKETREYLDELKFACVINNKRYHLCNENDEAGFCQQTFERSWFKKNRVLVDFIKHDDIKRLIDGEARCFSINNYGFGDV